MKNTLYFLLFTLSLTSFFGCASDQDDLGSVGSDEEYVAPTWRNVQTTPNTGTPSEQIERFLKVNNLTAETTPEGLVYLIEEEGSGERPTISDNVTAFYRGYKVNGEIFDQTYRQPRSFSLKEVVKGWQIGLPKIKEGGRILMLVRPSLGYGSQGRPRAGISGTDVLVFEVVLEKVD